MNTFIYRIVPFLIAMILGEFIYHQLDKRYKMTEKMYQTLHIRKESLGVVSICVSLLMMLIIGIIGVCVIPFSTVVYIAVCGVLAGFVVAIQRAVRQ